MLRSRKVNPEGKTLYALLFDLKVDTISSTEAVRLGVFRTETEFSHGSRSLAAAGLAFDRRPMHGVRLK